MADIQLRFNHDILILSSPIREQLKRLGQDETAHDMSLLIEPEIYEELYALDAACGAQCLVTDTASLTPARLAHSRLEAAGEELAHAAIAVVAQQNPQHILVELGPCGLPLDPSSKASLNEARDQFTRAARFFSNEENLFDAYFLNDFDSCTELKCALMGLRKITDKPVFASVKLSDCALDYAGERAFMLAGRPTESLLDAVQIMAEYGAQVVGFSTPASPEVAAHLVAKIRTCTSTLPILAQLVVHEVSPDQEIPTATNPYFEADTMVDAADALTDAGAQFLRAVGVATPSYMGALVAATIGDVVKMHEPTLERASCTHEDPEALAEILRKRVTDALRN